MSKTPKIIAQLESRPEICPHKGRAKRTLPAPTVARCGMRSHTRMQALQPIPIGWRVHTAPRHRSRTAVTHSIHMPKTQLRPNTLKCAHRTISIRPRGSTKSGAHSCSHFPGRHARSKRTDSAPLGHQGQPARRPSTRSLPGSPRPLERQPATPSGSRPEIDGSKAISNVVRRGNPKARRS